MHGNEDTNLQVVHFGKDGLEVMELAENNDETKAGGTRAELRDG